MKDINLKKLLQDRFYKELGNLGDTVRVKKQVVGSCTNFINTTTGENVNCTLYDYYSGDFWDTLDDELISLVGALGLRRRSDEVIVRALSEATNSVGDYSTGLTMDLIIQAIYTLNSANVPDDGQRYAVVSSRQWEELFEIKEFVDNTTLVRSNRNKWLGITWILHNSLPVNIHNERDCFIYHSSAVGHAVGKDIMADVTWHGDRASYFVNNAVNQGACLIDDKSVVKIKVKEY